MSEMLVPHIPEDAPFSQAQRAWLNGFIAGLYSYAPAQASAQEKLRVAILYGSQTGTAEGLARKLAKHLKAAKFDVALSSLEGYVPATLATEKYAIFIVSTYGEGEAPDTAQAFFQQLCVEHFPSMGNVSYAVLALGDSHYEQFCRFGKDLDAKMHGLGATRLLDRVDCDVDVDAPFAAWKAAVDGRLRVIASSSEVAPPAVNGAVSSPAAIPPPTSPASPAAVHISREHPYSAPVVEKRALTSSSSSKRTIHLSFSIDESQMQYEAGDACGVVPHNSSALVDMVLELLPFTGNELLEIPKAGVMPLHQALIEKFAISRLTRNIVSQYASLAHCARLDAMMKPEQLGELESYLHGRDLVDLLKECPGAIQTTDQLIKILPRLTPRLYSISSSPLAHRGQVHTTVSVVRFRAHERDRGGVCSTLLDDRVDVGDRLPLYIHPNKKFRLPKDPSAPIVMIGPGTGIAPFRGFLHDRRAKGATGRNWLFFGERSAATDFLYREELESMVADGHLTQLDTAFSRDREHKVYVQDLMMLHAKQLFGWIEEGAFLYVCGDAFRMAKDVDRTLHTIVESQGRMSQEDASVYMQKLKDDHRYQRDVY
jgi:sulfite reductase (NADPH) flavoprotein alpha-component